MDFTTPTIAPIHSITENHVVDEKIECFSISSDGKTLAISARGENRTRVLVLNNSGNLISSIEHYSGGETGIAFWPDNNHVLFMGRNLMQWEIGTQKTSQPFSKILDQHFLGSAFFHGFNISKNGRYLVIQPRSETALIINTYLEEAKKMPPFNGEVIFSPDGKLAGVSTYDEVSLVELESGNIVSKTKASGQKFLAFSLDKRVFITALEPSLKVWKTEPISFIKTPSAPISSPVSIAEYSPDGKILVTGHEDGSVCFWNTSDYQFFRKEKSHLGGVHAIKFSGAGYEMFTADRSSVIRWQ